MLSVSITNSGGREPLGWSAWKRLEEQGDVSYTARASAVSWSSSGLLACRALRHILR